MYELLGGIIVGFATLWVSFHRTCKNFEGRLTRIETKMDLSLKRNGIDPEDCDKGGKHDN